MPPKREKGSEGPALRRCSVWRYGGWGGPARGTGKEWWLRWEGHLKRGHCLSRRMASFLRVFAVSEESIVKASWMKSKDGLLDLARWAPERTVRACSAVPWSLGRVRRELRLMQGLWGSRCWKGMWVKGLAVLLRSRNWELGSLGHLRGKIGGWGKGSFERC